MCIQSTVGHKAKNFPEDVIVVQVLLNHAWSLLNDPALRLGTGCDAATKARILYFQQRFMKMDKASGKVGPNDETFKALCRLMLPDFDADKLHGIMWAASRENIATYFKHLVVEMELRSINTPLRRSHFLAQLAHESGCLRYAEEVATGEDYEGRSDLGNSLPGDGPRFKGRGLIQLTGRHNYKAFSKDQGTDYTIDGQWATLANDPAVAVAVSGWFWEKKKLNERADTDDIKKVTRPINPALKHLEERTRFLERGKFFLGIP